MKILAIETATEACSAALDIDNTCSHQFEIVPRQHTQLILPMIDKLLIEADIKVNDLDAIAYGQGPGAFTGVRIAIGVLQGLAFAHDLPVIPISTMAILAQQFANDYEHVATAIDARMQEVYWGCYKRNDFGLMQLINEENVYSPTEIPMISTNEWLGAGTGWETYHDELKRKFTDNLIAIENKAYPSAKDLIPLAKHGFSQGHAISIEQASPVYLRNKVTH
ncbi:MAG: tRNA (adenosine(37)-N6)-threonylcarbamoyltransferase complex dimerization subunit type 1 TsaB [Pseudomonadota bacterium]